VTIYQQTHVLSVTVKENTIFIGHTS